MTRKTGLRMLLMAAVAAALGRPAQATILDGIQPAALDQPQINMIVYPQGQNVPQIGLTQDPLTGADVSFFNVQAYLDTGASGILISSSTADLLHLTMEKVGGVDVIYSDVGVAGTDDFSVSTPLHLGLAPFIPGQDLDQFNDINSTSPIVAPYTIPVPSVAGANLRVQSGPYVPPVATTGGGQLDPIDQLIEQLAGAGSALDVVGMPAIKGHVMVIDPTGVKSLGLIFDILGGGGSITDITDAELNALTSAGVKTYLYSRATAPAFDPNRTNDPGIPTPQRRVKLSYGSFDRFTELHLYGSTVNDPTLPSPALDHNPFIGKDPVAVLDGLPAGDAPGITISRTVGTTVLPSTGNWLLDTGAAASIISETQALALHVKYDPAHRPGAPSTTGNPADGATPILIDSITSATVPDQFTLVLGGIGGQEVLAGFWLDSLLLPTMEATAQNNPDLNIYFTHVPVLVGNITVKDPHFPNDPTKWLTLDGIFGMNMLIESINIQTDATGNITDLGTPSPSFFQWITFDEPNGELGLTFDPTTVPEGAVPEPASLGLLAAGGIGLLLRRRASRA